MNEKIRLNHLKHRARQVGMHITKSRRRDAHAPDYGLYALVDDEFGALVLGGGAFGLHSCTVEEISDHLALLGAQPHS